MSEGPEDASYFIGRAERQLRFAEEAQHRKVVQAHYELANLYLDIAYREPVPVEETQEVA